MRAIFNLIAIIILAWWFMTYGRGAGVQARNQHMIEQQRAVDNYRFQQQMEWQQQQHRQFDTMMSQPARPGEIAGF